MNLAETPAIVLCSPQSQTMGCRRSQTLKRRWIFDHCLPNRRNQRRRTTMAQVKIYYEPEMELLTVFWQAPRTNQICTELGNGIILY